ncbi:MAG: ABC-2 family transporter protein [Lentisphaeria bacterium]|jgi:ABC-2 type transport system permease protein
MLEPPSFSASPPATGRRQHWHWHRFRLLRLFWGSAVAAEAEYRLNFALAVVTCILNLGGSLFGLFLFYHNGYRPGGWDWPAAVLVLACYTFLDGFSSTLLAPNLNRIVRHVQEGTLDFVLLKPVDAQFWLSTRMLSLWGVPNLLAGLALAGWAAHRLGLGAADLAAGALLLLPALLILYSLWFILSTLSIWFVKVFNITFVLRNLLEAGRFPVDAFPRRLRLLFTFVVPVAFLTTVPAQAMTRGLRLGWLAGALLLAATLSLASRAFWRFALRHYSSASS